ncbi:hypothetical protein GH890_32010, partial [Bacillus thuringiensis]|nr:hypothetical protein [Bacillus thuringiensis]
RPPLVLNFSQPASNYLAFRERLESGLVSLENVVLRDYTIAGTIKVKNAAFEKVVTVRHTFDSWKTRDVVPPPPPSISCASPR